MNITVVYALPGRQIVRELELDAGGDIGTALRASGLLEEFPEIEGSKLPVGIFGRITTWQSALEPGDRVEIYRPLKLEPKQARRKRAGRG